jgi:hypothetical protein
MNHYFRTKPILPLLLASGIVTGAAFTSKAAVKTSSETWIGTSTTIQGNGGTGTKITQFAQRMVAPVETAGSVCLLQNETLSDTNSAWADGQFGTNGAPAYVEFDNGWMADIANCSGSMHCLTLAGGLGGAVSTGNSYRIHKHFTIASMFGTNNEAGLASGLNPSSTDNIILVNPQTQRNLIIFYYNDGTYHGWLNSSFMPADNQIIYPEQWVMVRRHVVQDTSLYLVGPVKTGTAVVTVDSGFNLVGTLKSATAMNLSALNLYTGDTTTGLASGLNPSSSDNLLVAQPNGTTAIYFYYNDGTYQGWVDGAFNPAPNAQIAPGTAFFIHRKAANAPFNWTIPAE